MDTRTLIIGGVAAGALYYIYRNKEGSSPADIKEYHKRAVLSGHAVGRGHRGATRYVQQGRYYQNLPAAQGRSYRVTRAIAEKQYKRNLRSGTAYNHS